MINPEKKSPQFSAENLRSAGAPADLSRRRFLQALGLTSISTTLPVASGVSSLILPQGAEAAESSRSINWKEVLGRFGESVVIAGERDESGADMIVGRTMNEIYKLYLQQQKDWCAEDAAYCEGETPHARRDNRVLVPSDYILSVPIPRAGQSVTSRDADKIPSIYLPLNGYTTAQNIADFARYADDILGLSGQYSDLQMVDENGDSRPLLLSKQGVPVFFSAEELLFIYAHYRMNKVTAEEIKFAGTVLDYGGVNSAAQARALRYDRIGNVRWAGMNNLQKALEWMFVIYRYINDADDQSIDSIAPSENYKPMTEYWNEDGYWKGGRKISAEQSQARIRAMLAKDAEPLGSVGRGTVLPGVQNLPIPEIKNTQGQIIRGKDIIDIANELYPNDPLKASQLVFNWLSRSLFQAFTIENRGFIKREQLQQGNKTPADSPARKFLNFISLPRTFLTEKAASTKLVQN